MSVTHSRERITTDLLVLLFIVALLFRKIDRTGRPCAIGGIYGGMASQ